MLQSFFNSEPPGWPDRQPALSSYISNLEKYLGVKLFDRTGKRFVLTAIGEEYVKRAEVMLQMKAEFDELLE